MDQRQSHGPAHSGKPDRRKFPRLPTHGRLLGCLLDSDHPLRIREIGYGGFATETVEPLPLKKTHTVRFTAMDDESAVLQAQTLYTWPSCANDGSPRYVTGFEFGSADSAETHRIVKMLIEKVTSVGLHDDEE